MATLLLLAFEDAPLLKDARNPPDQSHQLCGPLDMGQKGREVNRRERLARPISGSDAPAKRRHATAISGRYRFHSE